MSEISFTVFCVTVIALTAIARGNDEITEKALSTLSSITKGLMSIIDRITER